MGKVTKKLDAGLKVPTVIPIIRKCNTFGTTRILPIELSWSPGQTEQLGEMGLGQGGDQEPNCLSEDNHLCVLHQAGLRGRVAKGRQISSKKHVTDHLEFGKRNLEHDLVC